MTRATDAAIERAEDLLVGGDVATHLQSLSDALVAHFGNDVPASLAGYVLPVVVDPIVQMVREAFAKVYDSHGNYPASVAFRNGENDDTPSVQAALSVARAIAAQGGERG